MAKSDDDDISMINSVAEDDNDDEAVVTNTSARHLHGRSLLHARVRLTSGVFSGTVGTIVDVKCGWYTLDESCGVHSAVRARDFEVLTYGDGSSGGNGAESESTNKDDGQGEWRLLDLGLVWGEDTE